MGIRYAVNEKFFDRWSPRMAYLLGYLYADGDLIYTPKMRGRYVGVTSTDRETISKFKLWLGSGHTIIQRESPHKNGKLVYRLRIGNAKLYKSLERKGLYQNKSLTITFPSVPRRVLRHFIRGYFDGDGCVHLEKIVRKSGKIRPKKLNVIFTSGSGIFLKVLSERISEETGVKPANVIRSWTAYQLRYSTFGSECLFKLMYDKAPKNEYLERKYAIFTEHFEMKA